MDRTDWADLGAHVCIVGWPDSCGSARNLGFLSISITDARSRRAGPLICNFTRIWARDWFNSTVGIARSLVSIDDVGVATAFLAHDAAHLITGETLYVDGGYHIMD